MIVAKLPEGEAKDTLAAKNRNPEQTVRPSWTDMDALCAAMRRTKSRGEAAALLATWRTPTRVRREEPAPVVKPLKKAPLSRDEEVRLSRGVIAAIEAAEKRGTPCGK